MEIQFPGPAEIILSSTSSFVECFSLEPTRNILNLPTQISKEPILFCFLFRSAILQLPIVFNEENV